MQILYTIIGYTDPGNNQFVFQNVTKIAQIGEKHYGFIMNTLMYYN